MLQMQAASTHSAPYTYLMPARGHLLSGLLAMLALLLSTLAANADADWPRYPTDAEIAQMEKEFADACKPDAGWAYVSQRPADATVRSIAVKRHDEFSLKAGSGPLKSQQG